MIKSEFRIGYIFLHVIAVMIISVIFISSISVMNKVLPVYISAGLVLLVVGGLIYIVLVDCKLVMIDKENERVIWKSAFRPFGVVIDMKDLTGYVRRIQSSKFEERPFLFLIGENNKTVLKVSGFICENIDELIDALDLPEKGSVNGFFY